MLKLLKEVIEVKEENQVFKILAMNLPFLPLTPYLLYPPCLSINLILIPSLIGSLL